LAATKAAMSSGQKIAVNIRCMTARTFTLQIGALQTVSVLKDMIAEKEGVEKNSQRVSDQFKSI
jgi:ribosomal protein L11